jgi:uncharacterized protein YaaW (UPF0174 family)
MDKALLMSGGAYPRRSSYKHDDKYDDDKYVEDYAEEYAKRLFKSAYNPWINFLEKKGLYDKISELREEYNKLKEEKGLEKPKTHEIPEPLLDHYLKLKSLQINKFKKAKEILDKIVSNEPNEIKKQFTNMVRDEWKKLEKLGFTREDFSKVYAKAFKRLVDALSLAEEEYKKQQARKLNEPITPPPPPTTTPPQPAIAKGYPRPSYKLLAKQLARKYGFRLPRSARQHGKTWKEIYIDLTTGLK